MGGPTTSLTGLTSDPACRDPRITSESADEADRSVPLFLSVVELRTQPPKTRKSGSLAITENDSEKLCRKVKCDALYGGTGSILAGSGCGYVRENLARGASPPLPLHGPMSLKSFRNEKRHENLTYFLMKGINLKTSITAMHW